MGSSRKREQLPTSVVPRLTLPRVDGNASVARTLNVYCSHILIMRNLVSICPGPLCHTHGTSALRNKAFGTFERFLSGGLITDWKLIPDDAAATA
ncbi:unnamed protein product [Rhodiola kirilowii]